jgi:hypothetical protein
MNPLVKLIITFGAPILAAAGAASPPIQDLILDDHTVYAVPVSGRRITTISFPGPISAIDGAFVTTDPKNPGLFQLAHTKGTSYFSTRALAKDATTNLNVRWNGKTYVFELKESSEACYSVLLQARDTAREKQRRPLTSPRLLGMLDKAKAFPLLKLHYPEAVEGVDYRDGGKEPSVSDCSEYEVRLQEAFRFNADDTLIFRLAVKNKTTKPIEFVPERTQLKVGSHTYFPSVAQLSGSIPPNSTVEGYLAVTGTAEGDRNDLSLKNDFTFVLSRVSPEVQAAVRDFEKLQEGFMK